jgi:carbonic anhydrase
VVQTVWNNLPLERDQQLAATSPIDPAKLLPDDPRYITYMGSLTKPPCTEGVLWIVMKTPVQISAEQIAIFAHLYSMNARPLQPSNGRLIKESN